MPVEIRSQITGKTMHVVEAPTLYRANLQGTNLQGANLQDADLRNANLRGAHLDWANLQGTNLQDADLRWATLHGATMRRINLWGANLYGADLCKTNLQWANLQGAALQSANLQGASLQGANLHSANLWGADLQGANLHNTNLQDTNLHNANIEGIPLLVFQRTSIVPQVGAFEGYKQCRGNVIVHLRIPAEAARSNATGRKCRAQFVDVIEVFDAVEGVSAMDASVIYRPGERVTCDTWEPDRWIECAGGIHFYLSREEAEANNM